MTRPEWLAAKAEHERRVDAAVAGRIRRRDRGQKHPIDDFLFEYYNHKPSHLRVWHPGAGVTLRDAPEFATSPEYRVVPEGVTLDVEMVLPRRLPWIDASRRVLSATLGRSPQLTCFGMHEWAMVYRTTPEQVRHTQLPLRLGHDGTDAVVEAHDIRCTHFDAFRFFTEPAKPRNAVQPTRDTQADLEQPGCLHAGMDTYKWAHKLSPLVPGELVMDCFDLAREIRTVDMQASPYNVTGLGHAPIPVETPRGKAEYVRRQRDFAQRANVLRRRLLDALDLIEAVSAGPHRP